MRSPVDRIRDTFARLDTARTNLVSLALLRPAVGLDRDTFDRALRQLRQSGILSLSQAEGRHGLTDADRAAAIREGDSLLLLYVSRRPT